MDGAGRLPESGRRLQAAARSAAGAQQLPDPRRAPQGPAGGFWLNVCGPVRPNTQKLCLCCFPGDSGVFPEERPGLHQGHAHVPSLEGGQPEVWPDLPVFVRRSSIRPRGEAGAGGPGRRYGRKTPPGMSQYFTSVFIVLQDEEPSTSCFLLLPKEPFLSRN